MARYFAGDFGKTLLDCSYVALTADRRPVSVTLVSLNGDEPLLAQVHTAPEFRNRGLASALIQMGMNALAEKGLPSLNLVVTARNHPAERLYQKLEFIDVVQ